MKGLMAKVTPVADIVPGIYPPLSHDRVVSGC
jgi:hypothetical protein